MASNLLGKLEVDDVKKHDQVFIIVDLLKCANDSRLAADAPDKVLVRKDIMKAHSFLVDDGKLVLVNGGGVIAVACDFVSYMFCS